MPFLLVGNEPVDVCSIETIGGELVGRICAQCSWAGSPLPGGVDGAAELSEVSRFQWSDLLRAVLREISFRLRFLLDNSFPWSG